MTEPYDQDLFLGYVEGDLSSQDAERFERMMAADERLRNLVGQMRIDRQAARSLAPEPAPADLMEQVERGLELRMLLDDAPSDGRYEQPRRFRIGPWLAYGGIAALVAISATVVLVILNASSEILDGEPSLLAMRSATQAQPRTRTLASGELAEAMEPAPDRAVDLPADRHANRAANRPEYVALEESVAVEELPVETFADASMLEPTGMRDAPSKRDAAPPAAPPTEEFDSVVLSGRMPDDDDGSKAYKAAEAGVVVSGQVAKTDARLMLDDKIALGFSAADEQAGDARFAAEVLANDAPQDNDADQMGGYAGMAALMKETIESKDFLSSAEAQDQNQGFNSSLASVTSPIAPKSIAIAAPASAPGQPPTTGGSMLAAVPDMATPALGMAVAFHKSKAAGIGSAPSVQLEILAPDTGAAMQRVIAWAQQRQVKFSRPGQSDFGRLQAVARQIDVLEQGAESEPTSSAPGERELTLWARNNQIDDLVAAMDGQKGQTVVLSSQPAHAADVPRRVIAKSFGAARANREMRVDSDTTQNEVEVRSDRWTNSTGLQRGVLSIVETEPSAAGRFDDVRTSGGEGAAAAQRSGSVLFKPPLNADADGIEKVVHVVIRQIDGQRARRSTGAVERTTSETEGAEEVRSER